MGISPNQFFKLLQLFCLIATSTSDDSNFCNTAACNTAASMLSQNMNSSADPCDDFYDFACGNYVATQIIPEDNSFVKTTLDMVDRVQVQIKTAIESIDPITHIKPFVLAKKAYDSCMNKAVVEVDGVSTIKSLLKQFGGWPVLERESWNETGFDWEKSWHQMIEAGFRDGFLFNLDIYPDTMNSSRRRLYIDEIASALSIDSSVEETEQYFDYMKDIAKLLGATEANLETELVGALTLETDLAEVTLPLELQGKPSLNYNRTTISELQTNYSSFSWLKYFNLMLGPSGLQVDSNETVIVMNPGYLKAWYKIWNAAPKRTQANYLMWRAVQQVVDFLPEQFRQSKFNYDKASSGATKMTDRWEECTYFVSKYLHIGVDALYVRNFFTDETRLNAASLVREIRKAFRNMLRTVSWMDDATRSYALEKSAAMSFNIGHSQALMDDDKIEKYYLDLTDIPDLYLKTALALELFMAKTKFDRLKKPVYKNDWRDQSASTVNAHYITLANRLSFNAAIIQEPIFNYDRPNYLNYGTMGFIVGHELTHGFDGLGRVFDKNGNTLNWWTPASSEIFNEKAKCILGQYNSTFVPEVNLTLSGAATNDEDIADIGGRKIAYLAYEKWAKTHTKEKALRGFEKYTPSQMFWIFGANLFCSKYRTEALRDEILNMWHSPDKYRVLLPDLNNEEFAKDFNCPVGSKMNPVKKCQVW